MHRLIYMIYLALVFFGKTYAQKDSAETRYEISIGAPMLPLFYNNEYAGIFGDEANPPAQLYIHGQEFWEEDGCYLIPDLTGTFKVKLNAKHKLVSGIIYGRPHSYSSPDFYFIFYQGIKRVISKPERKYIFSTEYSFFLGQHEYYDYYGTTGNHGIGLIKEGKVFLIGLGAGMSMQYLLTKRLFFESEISLAVSHGRGTGIVEKKGYTSEYSDIDLRAWGVMLTKFLSINLGYKF